MIQFKNERLKVYRLSAATFYDRINNIYQFIKPFLDKQLSIFEEYGAFIACFIFSQLNSGYDIPHGDPDFQRYLIDNFRSCPDPVDGGRNAFIIGKIFS